MGYCDGQKIQAPQQRGLWRDIGRTPAGQQFACDRHGVGPCSGPDRARTGARAAGGCQLQPASCAGCMTRGRGGAGDLTGWRGMTRCTNGSGASWCICAGRRNRVRPRLLEMQTDDSAGRVNPETRLSRDLRASKKRAECGNGRGAPAAQAQSRSTAHDAGGHLHGPGFVEDQS